MPDKRPHRGAEEHKAYDYEKPDGQSKGPRFAYYQRCPMPKAVGPAYKSCLALDHAIPRNGDNSHTQPPIHRLLPKLEIKARTEALHRDGKRFIFATIPRLRTPSMQKIAGAFATAQYFPTVARRARHRMVNYATAESP